MSSRELAFLDDQKQKWLTVDHELDGMYAVMHDLQSAFRTVTQSAQNEDSTPIDVDSRQPLSTMLEELFRNFTMSLMTLDINE
jgi:hypothetical protein